MSSEVDRSSLQASHDHQSVDHHDPTGHASCCGFDLSGAVSLNSNKLSATQKIAVSCLLSLSPGLQEHVWSIEGTFQSGHCRINRAQLSRTPMANASQSNAFSSYLAVCVSVYV